MGSDPAARRALGTENANLLTRLLRQPRRKIVTLVTGADALESEDVASRLRALAPDAELQVIDGGQPTYPYLLGVE